jgi:ribonuclease HI
MILPLSNYHRFEFDGSMGTRSNNYAKIVVLKLALRLASEKGVERNQVFGDSQIVIKWMVENYTCLNYMLRPILEETSVIKIYFHSISFQYIYRERKF